MHRSRFTEDQIMGIRRERAAEAVDQLRDRERLIGIKYLESGGIDLYP